MHLSVFDVRSFRGDGFVTDHLLVVSEVREYFQQVNEQYRSLIWRYSISRRGHWRPIISTVLNLWVPQNAGSFLDSSETSSCWRKSLLRGVSQSVCLSYASLSVELQANADQNHPFFGSFRNFVFYRNFLCSLDV